MDLNECFQDLIKDTYNAEKQLLKALPKMSKSAMNPQLKEAFERHRLETEEHCRRLEQVAQMCGFRPTGVVCKGMQGLIDECNEHMGEMKPGPLMDAMMALLAQKNEHYEIAAYGTAVAWAKVLGKNDCIDLLTQTLNDEERTDDLLTEMAEGTLNQEAMNTPMEEKKSSGGSRSKSSSSSSSSKSGPRSKASSSKSGMAKKVSVR